RRSNIVLINTPDPHLQVRLITNPEDAAEHLASANIVGLGRCFGRGPMPSILFAHASLPYRVSFIKNFRPFQSIAPRPLTAGDESEAPSPLCIRGIPRQEQSLCAQSSLRSIKVRGGGNSHASAPYCYGHWLFLKALATRRIVASSQWRPRESCPPGDRPSHRRARSSPGGL